jgi:hypothetical protein
MTVKGAVTPPEPAVIVETVRAATVEDETLNVAVVWPAGTTTLAGTTTQDELLCSGTVMPPEGAGPLKMIVPVAPAPPKTVFGATDSDAADGGCSVSVAV